MTSQETLDRIRIVMVRSRSPGNVGSALRAMTNFGLSDLALAALPDFEDPDFFTREASKMAWRSAPKLERATLHDDLAGAIADTTLAFGTAPRSLRGSPELTPREAAAQLVEAAARGERVALVFGGEADGLRKTEMSQLTGTVRIPTGEEYQDLNLSQSVVVCAYEIFQAVREVPVPPDPEDLGEDAPAPHALEQVLFDRAHGLLDECGYFKGPGSELADELRRLLSRSPITRRDANLLQEILTQITWAVRQGKENP